MTDKLKLQIGRIGDLVLVKVLSQPDDWRGKNSSETKVFVASNGFMLKSMFAPELKPDRLFVRGESRDKDGRVASFQFTSPASAEAAVKRIQVAVHEFNKALVEDEPKTDEAWGMQTIVAC